MPGHLWQYFDKETSTVEVKQHMGPLDYYSTDRQLSAENIDGIFRDLGDKTSHE